MICEQCKKDIGKELRARCGKANEALHLAGLVYYPTLGYAVRMVNDLLLEYGFDVSRTDVRRRVPHSR